MIITIANSGSFIPQETIKDIFEAFYTNGKRGGTGLGLTISKKIILDHGGDITCRSVPETGTEFSFTLPAGEKDISPLQELSQSKDTLPKDSHEIRARFEASLHHRAG